MESGKLLVTLQSVAGVLFGDVAVAFPALTAPENASEKENPDDGDDEDGTGPEVTLHSGFLS
jgi:hypothetical protein